MPFHEARRLPPDGDAHGVHQGGDRRPTKQRPSKEGDARQRER
jgi:hypothetical protein